MIRKTLLAVCLAAVFAAPVSLMAQTTNKPSADKKPASKEAPAKGDNARTIPFNGELTALDKTAKTITVGKRVFSITSETKLYKGEKQPATLDDGKVGDHVTGSYKKLDGDKLVAHSVYFGGKNPAKKAAASDSKSSTAK